MSLSDLASLGSFASGIAVVVTLLFLLLQLRQSNLNQKSLMQQGRTARTVDLLTKFTDPNLAAIILRAFRADPSLTDEEYFVFYGYAGALFWNYEDSFLQFKIGTLDQLSWASDVSTLERLLAPEYIHTDVNGDVFTRARWLEYIKQKKNAQAVNDITFHDVHIQVAGSVAWVTGENVFSGPAYATEKGAPGTRKLRFTQIWVKRDGTWQRAAFQATWETSAAAGR